MRFALALVGLLVGCVQSGELHCADGRLCAPGFTCDNVNHRCISPEQMGACANLSDGDACTFGGAQGTCLAGACEPLVCGDGVRSIGEACDGTDFGGATCKDAGFYDEAGLACTQFCTFEVSGCTGYCGDGKVNGDELCDGAPPAGTCAGYGFDAGAVGCGTQSCGLAFDQCAQFGWQSRATGLDFLYDLSGTSPEHLWAVGVVGTTATAASYDGAGWTRYTLPIPQTPTAVAATVTDAWVVATKFGANPAALLRFTQGQWGPASGVPLADYTTVWAASSSAVYVGTTTGVLFFDGTAWTATTFSSAVTRFGGTSSSDVWATLADGTLQHWNGAAWSLVSVAVAGTDIYAAAPDDVWLIGASSSQPDVGAFAHWDGASWAVTTDSSIRPQTGTSFSSIAGVSNDAWISEGGGGALRHFDGIDWTRIDGQGGPFTRILSYPGESVAGNFNGRVLHYRGQTYAHESVGSFQGLVGSWSAGPNLVVALDKKGSVYRFDGRTWTKQVVDSTASTTVAIAGTSGSDLWVVSSSGSIFHYDGTAWSQRTTLLSPRKILAFSPSNVWIFGLAATRYNGTSFDTVSPPGNPPYIAASASGPNDIWLVGDTGTGREVWHWSGSSWSTAPINSDTSSIFALAPNDVFATTTSNRILHFDGTSWSETDTLNSPVPLTSLSGSAHDDVFALATGSFPTSKLFHFDGTTWAEVRLPSDANVLGKPVGAIEVTPRRVDIVYDGISGAFGMRRLVRSQRWSCRATETDCGDGVDDDCDNLVDARDSDCP